MDKMTSQQSWALFCQTGYDLRQCEISKEQASSFIQRSRDGEDIGGELESLGGILKRKRKPNLIKNFKELYEKADKEGRQAVEELVRSNQIRPMVVQQHANPLDDNSAVIQQWVVPDGPCGFSNIIVKPGTSSFAKWLKKEGLADKSYYGGVSIWVGEYNQSYQKKDCYARAFAKVLNEAGITAYVNSRLD